MLEIFKLSYKNNYAIFVSDNGSDMCQCLEGNCKFWVTGNKYSYDHELSEYVAHGWKEETIKGD